MATSALGAITGAGGIAAITAARRNQELAVGGFANAANGGTGLVRAGGLLQPFTAQGIGSPLASNTFGQPLGAEPQPTTLGFVQTRGDSLVSTLLAPTNEAANDAANDTANGLLGPAGNATDPAQQTLPFGEALDAQQTQDPQALATEGDNALNPPQNAVPRNDASDPSDTRQTANPLAAQEPDPFAYYDPLDTNQDGVVSEMERYMGAQDEAATATALPESPSFVGAQASALYVNTAATNRSQGSLLDAVV